VQTLQTVAFLSSYALLHPEERFLVAVPKIVKGNWNAEFLKWLPDLPAGSPGLSKRKVLVLADSKEAPTVVPRWHSTPSGVLIITHDMFSMLVTNSKRGPRAKSQRSLSASGAQLEKLETAAQQAQQPEGPTVAGMLRDGPSVVVVDEAHVVKTDTALRSRALVSLKTRRRLALTGYPLQNNLSEMHAMISWADPDLISKKEWDREYAQPIMAGQMPDASVVEVRTMNRRLAVFHDLTSGQVQLGRLMLSLKASSLQLAGCMKHSGWNAVGAAAQHRRAGLALSCLTSAFPSLPSFFAAWCTGAGRRS
jgi:SNF2 family DNA or RNA helicase